MAGDFALNNPGEKAVFHDFHYSGAGQGGLNNY
jgi:hypothetical protein